MKYLFSLFFLFMTFAVTSRANDEDIPLTSDDLSAINHKRDERPTNDSSSSFYAKLAPDNNSLFNK